MTNHDAILRVFDASDRLGRKMISWQWEDDRPTLTPDEHDEMADLLPKAESRINARDHDHGTVVARVWMDGEEIDRVKWMDLDDD